MATLSTQAGAIKTLIHSHITSKTLPLSINNAVYGVDLEDLCDLIAAVTLQTVLDNGNIVSTDGGGTNTIVHKDSVASPIRVVRHGNDGVAIFQVVTGVEQLIGWLAHDTTTGECSMILNTNAGVEKIHIKNDGTAVFGYLLGDHVIIDATGNITGKNSGTQFFKIGNSGASGFTELRDGTSSFSVKFWGVPFSGSLSANRSLYPPNQSGTIAITSDIAAARLLTYALVPDANYSIPGTFYFLELSAITANRNLTLPTATAGAPLVICNLNPSASAFNWDLVGVPLKNVAGATLATLANEITYTFYGNGTFWRIID